METKAKLENALRKSMRAGDEVRKRTVRMALAAIKQTEVDRQIKVDEAGVMNILQKEIKTRKEALEKTRTPNARTWWRPLRPRLLSWRFLSLRRYGYG